MNFMYRIAQFFQGRYGIDKLCYVLIILYCSLCFVNIFVRSVIITIIALLIAALAIYRTLSKNISRRQKEAYIFDSILTRVKYFFSSLSTKFIQRKTHCFHTCPHCKAKLRLPRKRGKHTVSCPRCNQEFKMRVWFWIQLVFIYLVIGFRRAFKLL